jgi:quinolinate synthase
MQAPLPKKYGSLSQADLEARIRRAKSRLGRQLCILGHHYQRDEVIQFADFTGDSLKLSRQAAAQREARYIVFCGVHFMAESADILTGDQQIVCLPNMLAGCTMADMAEDAAVAAALDELAAATDAKVVPVAYVNTSAAVKAVTGRAGGACCTSSNVRSVFDWALRPENGGGAGGRKILAIPDEHLARNTAVAMGHSLEDCAVYDPALPNGGLTAQQIGRATFLLWKGHCYVHMLFRAEHVKAVRSQYPDITVIVHPECTHEVVQLADATGSTEQIVTAVAGARPSSEWAIGTESHLVDRLARQHPDKFIRVLSGAAATCVQMIRIDLPHLAWVLDNLAAGQVVNQVRVDPEIARQGRTALQRMIELKATAGLTRTKPHAC